MYKTEIFYRGDAWTIYVVIEDGHCILKEFLESLPAQEKINCIHRLKVLGNHGNIHNERWYRKETDYIYALKTPNVRICCFDAGEKRKILTHGFKKGAKGGSRVEKREYKKAEKIRNFLGFQ
jgi:hypothetical protein